MKEVRPYKVLGLRLKQIREQAKQSLIEVSGAVEIEPKLLEQFEAGYKLPDEDILMSMMSFLKVPDRESFKLLELAGYNIDSNSNNKFDEQLLKQVMMVIPIDNRVAYTDRAAIETNKNGVVLNFLLGDSGQVVSRVGMSNETAQQIVLTLISQLKNACNPKTVKAISAGSTKNLRRKPKQKNKE